MRSWLRACACPAAGGVGGPGGGALPEGAPSRSPETREGQPEGVGDQTVSGLLPSLNRQRSTCYACSVTLLGLIGRILLIKIIKCIIFYLY